MKYETDATLEKTQILQLLPKLVSMIKAFQKVVAVANGWLQINLSLENPIHWRQARLPQSGKLTHGISGEYRFHGIGCWVKTEKLEIDWDYGHNGRIDGFDAWRLYCFAQNTSDEYPEFRDRELVIKIIDEATSLKLIRRPFRQLQDDLFYLADND